MGNRRSIVVLSLILTVIGISVGGTGVALMYQTALEEESQRLREMAQSQARLMEAVARYDSRYTSNFPGKSELATLSQIREAHSNYTGFGETGEFTLARRQGENIQFLLSHRHHDLDDPQPVPMDSLFAEPMRRALNGQSGTLIGLDYRGQEVLAAHEPVAVLNLGIVAKIDLDEVRAPFLATLVVSAIVGSLLIVMGVYLFYRITNPLLEALSASEEKYRFAMDATKDGLWDWDISNNHLFFSDSFSRMLGLQSIEPTRQGWEALMYPEDRDYAIASLDKILNGTASTWISEHRLRTGDGDWKWVRSRGEVVARDTDGHPLRLTGTLTDIDERKLAQIALQESNEKFRALVETTHDFVWEVSADGIYTYCSPQTVEILGYQPEEMLGTTPFHYMPAEEAKRIEKAFISILEQEAEIIDLENINLSKDGRKVVLETSGLPFFDSNGKLLGYRGIDRNITRRKQTEVALKNYRTSLEQTVLERTYDLQQAKEQAEAASQVKSQFLANMSHEIRTPMNAIIGMSQMALGGELSMQQRHYLERSLKAARALLALVNNTLDLTRAESEGLILEQKEFSPRETVHALSQQLAPAVQEKDLDLQLEIAENVPGIVLGDRQRLGHILGHLGDNAVKFSHSGGRIVVTVDTREQDDRSTLLHFSVADNGAGIPDEQRERIFDAFTQADDSNTRTHGGTGLGLTIARALVLSMQGEIWVDSTPGKGSTFHFTVRVGSQVSQKQVAPSSDDLADIPEQATDTQVDREKIESLLHELHAQILDSSIEAAEVAQRLTSLLENTSSAPYMAPVYRAVSGYDFDEAMASLHKLAGHFNIDLS